MMGAKQGKLMIWKNLIVFAALIWFTTSYAVEPVVAEDMDDALQQKYEAPHAQKEQKRSVAQQGKFEEKTTAEEPDMAYWRWSDDSVQVPKD